MWLSTVATVLALVAAVRAAPCSGTTNIPLDRIGLQGTVENPSPYGGGALYGGSVTCGWSLVASGQQITLSAAAGAFDVACGHIFAVYDGPDDTAPQLFNISCGATLPWTAESTKGALFVSFDATAAGTPRTGFSLTYKTSQPTQCVDSQLLTLFATTGETGVFSNPAPSVYGTVSYLPSRTCQFQFDLPVGNVAVVALEYDLKLGNPHPAQNVNQGEDQIIMPPYCSPQNPIINPGSPSIVGDPRKVVPNPARSVLQPGAVFSLVALNYPHGVGRGFRMNYTIIDSSTIQTGSPCTGGNLTGSGTISSHTPYRPGMPDMYPASGSVCTWIITAPEGQFPAARFVGAQYYLSFGDGILFYDGPDPSWMVLFQAGSPGGFKSDWIVARGSTLRIDFSGSTPTNFGFQIEYTDNYVAPVEIPSFCTTPLGGSPKTDDRFVLYATSGVTARWQAPIYHGINGTIPAQTDCNIGRDAGFVSGTIDFLDLAPGASLTVYLQASGTNRRRLLYTVGVQRYFSNPSTATRHLTTADFHPTLLTFQQDDLSMEYRSGNEASQGFRMTITPSQPACGAATYCAGTPGVLTGPSGMFEGPCDDAPPVPLTCQFIIRGTGAPYTQLNLLQPYDVRYAIDVHDGDTTDAPLLYTNNGGRAVQGDYYSSYVRTPRQGNRAVTGITSTSGPNMFVNVTFQQLSYVMYLLYSWQTVVNTQCGKHITVPCVYGDRGSMGYISAPSVFDEVTPTATDQECRWQFKAPSTYHDVILRLTLVGFALGDGDTLAIVDTSDMAIPHTQRIVIGAQDIGRHIYTRAVDRTNTLMVVFKTPQTQATPGFGFRIRYEYLNEFPAEDVPCDASACTTGAALTLAANSSLFRGLPCPGVKFGALAFPATAQTCQWTFTSSIATQAAFVNIALWNVDGNVNEYLEFSDPDGGSLPLRIGLGVAPFFDPIYPTNAYYFSMPNLQDGALSYTGSKGRVRVTLYSEGVANGSGVVIRAESAPPKSCIPITYGETAYTAPGVEAFYLSNYSYPYPYMPNMVIPGSDSCQLVLNKQPLTPNPFWRTSITITTNGLAAGETLTIVEKTDSDTDEKSFQHIIASGGPGLQGTFSKDFLTRESYLIAQFTSPPSLAQRGTGFQLAITHSFYDSVVADFDGGQAGLTVVHAQMGSYTSIGAPLSSGLYSQLGQLPVGAVRIAIVPPNDNSSVAIRFDEVCLPCLQGDVVANYIGLELWDYDGITEPDYAHSLPFAQFIANDNDFHPNPGVLYTASAGMIVRVSSVLAGARYLLHATATAGRRAQMCESMALIYNEGTISVPHPFDGVTPLVSDLRCTWRVPQRDPTEHLITRVTLKRISMSRAARDIIGFAEPFFNGLPHVNWNTRTPNGTTYETMNDLTIIFTSGTVRPESDFGVELYIDFIPVVVDLPLGAEQNTVILTGPKSLIGFPAPFRYDGTYPPNINATWLLIPPADKIIRLTLMHCEVSSGFGDSVNFFEGSNIITASPIGSGYSVPFANSPAYFETTTLGQPMLVQFVSGSTQSSTSGFVAAYSATSSLTVPTYCDQNGASSVIHYDTPTGWLAQMAGPFTGEDLMRRAIDAITCSFFFRASSTYYPPGSSTPYDDWNPQTQLSVVVEYAWMGPGAYGAIECSTLGTLTHTTILAQTAQPIIDMDVSSHLCDFVRVRFTTGLGFDTGFGARVRVTASDPGARPGPLPPAGSCTALQDVFINGSTIIRFPDFGLDRYGGLEVAQCAWQLTSPPGTRLDIFVLNLDLPNSDTFFVSETPADEFYSIPPGYYSSSSVSMPPNDILGATRTHFLATGNSASVIFASSYSGRQNYTGFSVVATLAGTYALPDCSATCQTTSTAQTTTGVSGSAGFVSSPCDYSQLTNNEVGTLCGYTLTAPAGMLVSLYIYEVRGNSPVLLFDGPTSTSPALANVTRGSPVPFTGTQESMTVIYTDPRVTSTQSTGYYAAWSAIQGPPNNPAAAPPSSHTPWHRSNPGTWRGGPCPEHAICPGDDLLFPDPGYWNDGGQSDFVTRCEEPAAIRCPGGENATCGVGYTGILCGECIEGWYLQGSECLPCAQGPNQAVRYSVNGIVLFFFGVAHVVLNDNRLDVVITLFKALQSIRAAGLKFGYRLPQGVKDIFDNLAIVTFDFGFLQPACAVPSKPSFSYSFWGNAIVILILVALPMIAIFIMIAVRRAHRDFWINRGFRTVIVLGLLIYFVVVSRAIQATACVQVGPHHVLRAYKDTPCVNGGLIAAGVLGAILIAFLVPIAVCVWIYRLQRRSLLNDKDIVERYGYLYHSLQTNSLRHFFDLIRLVQLLLLAVAWNAIPYGFGPYGFSVACNTALMLAAVIWRPYITAQKNGLTVLSIGLGFVSSVASICTLSDSTLSTGGAIAVVVVAFVIVFALSFGVFFYERRRHARMPKKVDLSLSDYEDAEFSSSSSSTSESSAASGAKSGRQSKSSSSTASTITASLSTSLVLSKSSLSATQSSTS